MSWDSFREQVKNLTNQAAAKINRSADIAALQAKLSAAKRALEEAYTELGKVAYLHFANGGTTQADKVSPAMKNVKKAKREIAALQAKLKELKNEDTEDVEASDTTTVEAEEKDTPKAEEVPCQDTKKNTAPSVTKKDLPTFGEDFCMNVNISSDSAECEGAITLDWTE